MSCQFVCLGRKFDILSAICGRGSLLMESNNFVCFLALHSRYLDVCLRDSGMSSVAFPLIALGVTLVRANVSCALVCLCTGHSSGSVIRLWWVVMCALHCFFLVPTAIVVLLMAVWRFLRLIFLSYACRFNFDFNRLCENIFSDFQNDCFLGQREKK